MELMTRYHHYHYKDSHIYLLVADLTYYIALGVAPVDNASPVNILRHNKEIICILVW